MVAIVDVIDTGPGIPADVLGKIFSPYFTTKSGGTGLGLPTTRRIAEAHGGRLDVVSELGKGSDFRFVLPVHRPVHGASHQRTDASLPSASHT
jgi:signal transduction histidine kinase